MAEAEWLHYCGLKDINMKYAWIENNKIRDVCLYGNPHELYHPDVAILYDTLVPDEAKHGDEWIDGQLVQQKLSKPLSFPREWNQEDFRKNMTLSEKVKWDNNSTPEIVTVKAELPKPQEETQELVDFLVASNVISQQTADKIMQ